MLNQKGFVTSEFLIAVIIAFGLTILTFAMTFTLSIVEVAQYIVYSSSRAHAAANLNIDAQRKAAEMKYDSLLKGPVFAPLFSNGWFQLSGTGQGSGSMPRLEIRSGGGENYLSDYSKQGADEEKKNSLQGVRATFQSNLLELKLPLVGTISPEDDGFRARLTAMLIREVSLQECQKFMEDRVQALWSLGGGRPNRFKKNQTTDVPWEDNGC
ncbi:MAG: hypothetical protein ACAH59_12805 [Pseudobdellovibrionaceae bacterium]